MNRPELTPYHRNLAALLNLEPDRAKRKEFLKDERKTEQYRHAKEHVKTKVSPVIKRPILPTENTWYLSKPDETLVDVALTTVFENLHGPRQAANWAEYAFIQYTKMPNRTVGQKVEVKKFLRKTAEEFLGNIQHINVVDKKWKRKEAGESDKEVSQDSFSSLVKRESLALIKEKWRVIEPGQLSELVRILTDSNSPHQEFAKDMLTNYFKGPPDRCRPRVAACYNFLSGVLDLMGEDEAFYEGMKIAHYATNILPRDPGFIERVNVLSLPSDEEEKGGVFQKLLTMEYVTKQAIFMSSQDFSEYIRSNVDFANTDPKVIKEWKERKVKVTREMGTSAAASAKNNAVRAAMNVFLNASRQPLTEERKRELMDIWPFDEAFREDDPLNQKFEAVRSRLASSNQTH